VRYGEPLTKEKRADAEAARRGLMECRTVFAASDRTSSVRNR
jgi:hypothetical protein